MPVRARLGTLLVCTALVCFGVTAQKSAHQAAPGRVPKAGFVPDAATAVRIAEAVLTPIYGQQRVNKEKPFTAKLEKGVWVVEGTLPKEYATGGVAVVEISKRDGCILSVVHYK